MSRPRLFARRAIAVAAAGGLLTLVAFVFDAAPLFVSGVALLAVGLLAPAWVWTTARGARVQRRVERVRVVEEQPMTASIIVRRGWFGLGGWARLEIVDPLTGSRIELSGPLSPLRGGRQVTVGVVVRFPRRGRHTLPAPSLIVSDPLELARVETESSAPPPQLLVLPRTEAVRWLGPDGGRRFEQPDGDAASEAQAAVDVDGLRPYRPGTPASRIHWPAVARGAGLLERRLQADGDSRPLVVLDSRSSDPAQPPELLDAAVRAAASLVLDLARRGGCGLLLPGEQRATAVDRELNAWPAAHARLAMVSGGPETRAPAIATTRGRLGPMIYVACGPSSRMVSLLTAPGNGSVVLVVPRATLVGGRPTGVRSRMLATLEVSGCRGFRLGLRERPTEREAETTSAVAG